MGDPGVPQRISGSEGWEKSRDGSSPNPGAPGKERGSHHAAVSRRNAAGGRERRRRRRRSDF